MRADGRSIVSARLTRVASSVASLGRSVAMRIGWDRQLGMARGDRAHGLWPVAGYTSRETDDLRRDYTRKCAASRCERRSSQLSRLLRANARMAKSATP